MSFLANWASKLIIVELMWYTYPNILREENLFLSAWEPIYIRV